MRQVAQKVGVDEAKIEQYWRALGLPFGSLDDPIAYEETAEVLALLSMGAEMFGEDQLLQFGRLLGEVVARLADAMVSMFVVTVGPQAAARDPSFIELARANYEAAALLPPLMRAVEVTLRHHLELARRPMMPGDPSTFPGYEARTLAVGFADLTGSTGLAGRLTFDELGSALAEFEQLCTEIVHQAGGRVVKLIGDEVMFTAPTVACACTIGCAVVPAVPSHDVLPPVRVGIA